MPTRSEPIEYEESTSICDEVCDKGVAGSTTFVSDRVSIVTDESLVSNWLILFLLHEKKEIKTKILFIIGNTIRKV